jgi:hypothetical protein
MSTTPQASQARTVTDHFKEVSFEIQSVAQDYIKAGTDNEDMRNAIRSILALTTGLIAVLQSALQPRQ